MANLYEILGVRENARTQDIEKAYQRMLEEAGGEINDDSVKQAYQLLINPEARTSYNRELIDDIAKEMEAESAPILNLPENDLQRITSLNVRLDMDKSKLSAAEVAELQDYLLKVKDVEANTIPYLRQMIDLAGGDEKARLEKENEDHGSIYFKALKDLAALERLAQTLQEQATAQVNTPPQQAEPPDTKNKLAEPPKKPAPKPPEKMPEVGAQPEAPIPAPRKDPQAQRANSAPEIKPEVAAQQPEAPIPAQRKANAPIPAPRKDPPAQRANAAPEVNPKPAQQANRTPPRMERPPARASVSAPPVVKIKAPAKKELDQTKIGRDQVAAELFMKRFEQCKDKKSNRAIKLYNKADKKFLAAAKKMGKLKDENLISAYNNRQHEIKVKLNAGSEQIAIQPATHFHKTSIGDELCAARDMKVKADRASNPLDKANFYITAAEMMQKAMEKAEAKYLAGDVKYSKHAATKGLMEKMNNNINLKMESAMQVLEQAGPELAKMKQSINLRGNPAFKELANVRLYTIKAQKADTDPVKRAEYATLANQHMTKAVKIVNDMPHGVARNNANAVCQRYNRLIDNVTTYTKTALTMKERFFEPASNDALKAKHALHDALREIKKGEAGFRISGENVQKYLNKAQDLLDKASLQKQKGTNMHEFIASMQKKCDELNGRLQQLQAGQEVNRPSMRR